MDLSKTGPLGINVHKHRRGGSGGSWRFGSKRVIRRPRLDLPPSPSHPLDHLRKTNFGTMGRTRTKSKNLRHAPPKTSAQSLSAPSTTTPSIPALISKAQSIIEQCDYDLANQFIQRILQRSPNNVEAREMLGVVQLETGLVQEARKVSPSLFC